MTRRATQSRSNYPSPVDEVLVALVALLAKQLARRNFALRMPSDRSSPALPDAGLPRIKHF